MPRRPINPGQRIFLHAPDLCTKIRKLYDLYGMSLAEIQELLNTQGVKTPYGGLWRDNSIAAAITQAGGTIRSRSEAQHNAKRKRTMALSDFVVPKE
jgi:hypothetical protein